MKVFRSNLSGTGFSLLLIIISLVLSVWHYQPLYGSTAALILTVLFQFYLSGYLLARVFGKHQVAHPIHRFAWILVCAFSLNTILGGAARFLHVPIPVCVVLLHGVMLVLAVVKPRRENTDESPWQLSWQNTPLVILVILCCGVALWGGVERNHFRFNGYEDQTVFVELADWLAHDPDDSGIRSRRVGVGVGDSRWDTDGWTYTHAAWVWTSGVPAADLIWFKLTPLFIWTVPLAVFGMAYELTRREEAATWTTAALTLAALIILDPFVYTSNSMAFGQSALFQINTLRTIATALMTPLAFLTVFAYFQHPSKRHLLLVFLAALTLAIFHPRQIAILLYSSAAMAGLWWLAQPSRRRLVNIVVLGVALASVMLLPYWQRSTRYNLSASIAQQESSEMRMDTQGNSIPSGGREYILPLRNLPILGTSYIVEPDKIFYHPLIIGVTILGLLAVAGWRKSLAAQYIFGSTATTMILLFTPGLTPIFARLITLTLTTGIVFGFPVALTLGLTVDTLLNALSRVRFVQRTRQWFVALAAMGVMLALIFEPFPIPASARDQVRAANLMQVTRDMQPFDSVLVASLIDLLPKDQRNVLLTPTLSANYVVESVPKALITGGRDSGNIASKGTRRFLTEMRPPMPWLDSQDLAYLIKWHVTHIVLEADDTRLAQLLLQPQRFELLDIPAGFYVFRVRGDLTATPVDALFEQMNTLYTEQSLSRWGREGFDMMQPGSQEKWTEIAAEWERLPESDETQLGQAFTALMMGDDRRALPLWQSLRDAHPDIALFADALAQTHLALGTPANAISTLLAALDSPQAATRVQAVKTLLSENYYYLLDAAQMQTAIAVTERDALVWNQLALFNNIGSIRRRVVLMLSANQLDAALRWSNALQEIEVDPRDLLTRAAILLAQGDTDDALSVLQPADDADWYAANRYLHPDRWQDNVAAQAYTQLRTDLTARANGTTDSAQSGSVSLLTIADQHALYVMQPEIAQDDDDHDLTVTATFGSPHIQPYPVRQWRVQVASPDTSTFYATTLADAIIAPGALVRVPIPVRLPPDLPALTPARVFITPMYDNRITFGQAVVDVVLNRPGDAQPAADAQTITATFGSSIHLENYAISTTADALTLKLYWQADSALPENYQIFVHVVDESGTTTAQRDSAPVDGRYPTSQWRTDTLIEDAHIVPFDAPLPPGTYHVVIGMYRLPDGTRLPITPVDDRVQDNSLTIQTFTMRQGE